MQVTVTDTCSRERWTTLSPGWRQLEEGDPVWPLILICKGGEIIEAAKRCIQLPEWIVADGGAIHTTTTCYLAGQRYALWGVHKSVAVWTRRHDTQHQPRKHHSVHVLVNRVAAAVQRRCNKAVNEVGGGRFKLGVSEEDFTLEKVKATLMTETTEQWGEDLTVEEWELQPYWEWPDEPQTTRKGIDDHEVNGIEVKESITKEEADIRRKDLEEWKSKGQKWIDAFRPQTKKKVWTFLNENRLAVEAVVHGHHQGKSRQFGKTDDLIVEQAQLRPGARGKVWRWVKGQCHDVTPTMICRSEGEVAYNIDNIIEAAVTVGFKDAHALQMLAEWGVPHGTENSPLRSYAARNHQGAADQVKAVTKK